MDPFFQLAIGKREDVTYNESSNAQVSYAKRYSKGLFDDIKTTSSKESSIISLSSDPLTRQLVKAADGNTYTDTQTDADFGMKSAVFSGLSQLDASILQQPRHFCSVGNCTWDTFSSLAVCSACNDLTDRIVTEDKGDTTPLAVYLVTTNPSAWVTQVTEYQLPNGFKGDSSTLMTAYGTGNASESISFAAHDTLIWSMTMMNFTGNNQLPPTDPSPLKVSAIECGLWYCVNAYAPAVKNGNFTEIVRPNPWKRNVDSWQPIRGSYNETAIPPPNTINYDGLTSSVRRTDLQLDEGFNISQAAVYSISKWMNDTFAVSRKQGINAYILATENTTYKPTAIQSLYNSDDLEATFASLARSMTNNIRQNDDDGSVKFGTEGIYLILIRVRFWFLTLPVLLNVVGAIFLAVIIYHTHKSGLEVWTTNALPVVAFGRTIGPVFDGEKNMRTSVMEKKARVEIVQLMTSNELHDLPKTSSSRQHSGYEQITN